MATDPDDPTVLVQGNHGEAAIATHGLHEGFGVEITLKPPIVRLVPENSDRSVFTMTVKQWAQVANVCARAFAGAEDLRQQRENVQRRLGPRPCANFAMCRNTIPMTRLHGRAPYCAHCQQSRFPKRTVCPRCSGRVHKNAIDEWSCLMCGFLLQEMMVTPEQALKEVSRSKMAGKRKRRPTFGGFPL
jgi:hypothetical protein